MPGPSDSPRNIDSMRCRRYCAFWASCLAATLAADDLEGRRPGTPGGQKTVDYLTAQFRKFGLKPGNGDNYVQQVPLVEIRADADPTLSVAGGRGALLPLRQGTDM